MPTLSERIKRLQHKTALTLATEEVLVDGIDSLSPEALKQIHSRKDELLEGIASLIVKLSAPEESADPPAGSPYLYTED